jgi:hypothetical protein
VQGGGGGILNKVAFQDIQILLGGEFKVNQSEMNLTKVRFLSFPVMPLAVASDKNLTFFILNLQSRLERGWRY